MKSAEHAEQVALMRWARLSRGRHPELALFFAIPNGGQRNVIVAAKLKAEGVMPGVSDLILLAARGGYHGLLIEMKAGKGRPTPAQIEFQGLANAAGYKAVTCWGWEAAKEVIEGYLCN